MKEIKLFFTDDEYIIFNKISSPVFKKRCIYSKIAPKGFRFPNIKEIFNQEKLYLEFLNIDNIDFKLFLSKLNSNYYDISYKNFFRNEIFLSDIPICKFNKEQLNFMNNFDLQYNQTILKYDDLNPCYIPFFTTKEYSNQSNSLIYELERKLHLGWGKYSRMLFPSNYFNYNGIGYVRLKLFYNRFNNQIIKDDCFWARHDIIINHQNILFSEIYDLKKKKGWYENNQTVFKFERLFGNLIIDNYGKIINEKDYKKNFWKSYNNNLYKKI